MARKLKPRNKYGRTQAGEILVQRLLNGGNLKQSHLIAAIKTMSLEEGIFWSLSQAKSTDQNELRKNKPPSMGSQEEIDLGW